MIRQLENERRVRRLVENAIDRMALDLSGSTVLTEVASGPFVLTPIIAAAAGAEVIAVTRDSRFGAAKDVIAYGEGVVRRFGLGERITLTAEPPRSFADVADIVTNVGFLRPIDRSFVLRLKRTAMVCLMWSPWEFRDGDIDRAACAEVDIPIVGTNEEHPYVRTYDFVGLLAVKLLLERDVEIFGAEIAVIGSDPFGRHICRALRALGGNIRWSDPTKLGDDLPTLLDRLTDGVDAVVIAEHRDPRMLIVGSAASARLRDQGTEIIHICGAVSLDVDPAGKQVKHPPNDVPFGMMTVATDYVGPKPVVDLHAGSLKVGQVVVTALRQGLGSRHAVRLAEESGYGIGLQ